jgi:hypothetical protein
MKDVIYLLRSHVPYRCLLSASLISELGDWFKQCRIA